MQLPLSSARRTIVHDIVVGGTRLRIERDPATGEQTYFVDGQPRDLSTYLTVTQAHKDRAEARLRGH
jgi:hypothetical protein